MLGCSQAYEAGRHTWENPLDPTDFTSFGSGEFGSLAAVASSIVLSQDALSPSLDSDPTHGGVKEPVLRVTQIMRGLEFSR